MLMFVMPAFALDPVTVTPPDPVLSWAERDLRSLRRARIALLVSVAGPGLFLIGDEAVGSSGDVVAQRVIGTSLEVVGAASVATVPLLIVDTARSRRALTAQGLAVDRGPAWLAAPLWVVAVGGTTVAAFAQDGPFTDHPQQVLGVVVAYGSAVGLVAAQLRANHVARRDAGWLGVLPTGTGLALGGSW